MRFVLVVDDNGPEFTSSRPNDVMREVLEVLDQNGSRIDFEDRTGPVYAENNRVIGKFEVTFGETEGRAGWERTR